LKALLRTANGKHRALIVVALFSGLRASELRGLKWLDVDLERAVIRVRGRVDAWGEYGLPKSTAGHRDVPIAPYAIASLKEHRLITRNSDSDYVFVSESGTPLYHQNIINRIWNPLQIEAGLCTTHATKKDDEGNPVKVAKFNFHVLRHAAASLFIEQGLSPKRIQTIMGHSSITVTYDVYGHLFEDDEADQAAVAAIQARLLG
jgi:integrase